MITFQVTFDELPEARLMWLMTGRGFSADTTNAHIDPKYGAIEISAGEDYVQ